MSIPPLGLDGIRRTVNYGLSTDQTTWNFRSAFNVAALNCLEPQYANILPAYSGMLDRHERKLRRTGDAVVAAYRQQHGAAAHRAAFDTYMTQVYNYFALPPAHDAFCATALAIANESLLVETDQLDSFALSALQRFEGVFDNFYRSFEQYRVNLAAWDAEYGPPPTVFTPSTGLVALPAASGTLPQAIQDVDPGASVADSAPQIQLPPTVTLPGATPANTVSTPVVQAVPPTPEGDGTAN
jgi:hypothetical protein